jgi:TolB-like protein
LASNQRDYYVEGFAEDLIGALRRIPGLKVAAATSSFQAVRVSRDPETIGRQLGVSNLIGGSIARDNGRVRVDANILSATNGDTLFRLHFDTLERRDLDMQVEIADAIARDLQVGLSATGGSPRRSTQDPVAYDLYLQGRFAYEQRDQASLERAIGLFQQAIRQDSNFALAYSGLSDAYSLLAAFIYGPPGKYFPQAREAALHAVEKDSTLPQAQTSLGFVALFWDWDQRDALAHFNRAVALDSGLTQAYLFRSHVFLTLNQPDSAVASLRHAQLLEPFSQIVGTRLATALYYERKYDEAAQEGERVLQTDSMYSLGFSDLIRIYLAQGRCADALRIGRRPKRFFYNGARSMTGVAAARCGQPSMARQILAELRDDRRRGRYVAHFDLANISLALGDSTEAFAEFSQAVSERDFMLFGLGHDPMYDPLHQNPRFVALVNRVSLNNRN